MRQETLISDVDELDVDAGLGQKFKHPCRDPGWCCMPTPTMLTLARSPSVKTFIPSTFATQRLEHLLGFSRITLRNRETHRQHTIRRRVRTMMFTTIAAFASDPKIEPPRLAGPVRFATSI